MRPLILLTLGFLQSAVVIAQDSTHHKVPFRKTFWGSPWVWVMIISILLLAVAIIQYVIDHKRNRH